MNLTTDESNELQYLKSDLMALCAGIGGLDTNSKYLNHEDGTENAQYVVEEDALDCLKEIKHLIKIQTKEKYGTVRLLLGVWNIFQKDLVPIFLIEEEEFWTLKLHCLELMVILSWPIKDLVEDSNFDESLSIWSMKTNLKEHYRVLMSYKRSVIHNRRFFKELVKLLVFRLQKTEKWNDEDDMIFLQCLNLIRNLLAIDEINESHPEDAKASVISNLQGQLFERLKESQFLDLLVALASSINDPQYQSFFPIVMDIIYYSTRGYNLDDITFGLHLQNNISQMNALKRSNGEPKRHSRFGGTFEVRLPNGKSALYHDHQLKDLTMLEEDKRSKNNSRFNKKSKDLDHRIQPKMNLIQKEIFIKFYQTLINDGFQELYKASQRGINDTGLDSQLRVFNLLKVSINFANYHWTLNEKLRDNELVQLVIEIVTPKKLVHNLVTNMIEFKDTKKWGPLRAILETFTEWLRLIYSQSKFPLEEFPALKVLSDQVLHHFCHDYANLHLISQLYSNEVPIYLMSEIIKLTFYFNQSVKRMVSDRETVFVQKKRLHRIKRSKTAGKPQRTPSPHRIAKGKDLDDGNQSPDEHNPDTYKEIPTQDVALNSLFNNTEELNEIPGSQERGQENSDIENGDNEEGDFVEGVFDFKKYLSTFATESIVHNHIEFLNNILDETDDPSIDFKLQYVTKMLHSIGVESDYIALLLKVSYLQTYQKSIDILVKWELGQINGTIPKWLKELVRLVEFIVTRLVAELQKDPWLFAELLMSKSKHYFKKEEKKEKRSRKRKAGDLGTEDISESWLNIYQNDRDLNIDHLLSNVRSNSEEPQDTDTSTHSDHHEPTPEPESDTVQIDELGLFDEPIETNPNNSKDIEDSPPLRPTVRKRFILEDFEDFEDFDEDMYS